jgi:hypothetical protein
MLASPTIYKRIFSSIVYGSGGGTQKNSRRYMKFAAQTIIAANTILFCFTRGKINFSSYKMAAYYADKKKPAPGP